MKGPVAKTIPLVIAHRGASRDCPENTLAAFDEALRQGCDGIELDVQLTRDGVPVVFHDRTLARAGERSRPVAELHLADLKQMDAGATFHQSFRGERIPTLAEVLERYAGRTRLFIEVKTREGRNGWPRHVDLMRRTAATAQEAGAKGGISVLCFDLELLTVCAEAAARVPRILNLKPPRLLRPGLKKKLAGISALSVAIDDLTPEFASGAQQAGLPLLAFTCNTAELVDRAMAAGAAGIMSDRPAWLRERLARHTGAA